jgi:carbamoyl-phosphate synthase small subunit
VYFTTSHRQCRINLEDYEAERHKVSALVLRALSPSVRTGAAQSLGDWLSGGDIPGISGVVRFLTRKLRWGRSVQLCQPAAHQRRACCKQPGIGPVWMVRYGREVTCAENYAWSGDAASTWVPLLVDSKPPVKIVARFRHQAQYLTPAIIHGALVTVVPADTPAADAGAASTRYFLSNGPGDPAGLPYAMNPAGLWWLRRHMLGICLGHPSGLALGGNTARLIRASRR